jgi:hypothetical protein
MLLRYVGNQPRDEGSAKMQPPNKAKRGRTT